MLKILPEQKERLIAIVERQSARAEAREGLPPSNDKLDSYIAALNLCLASLHEIECVVDELHRDIQAIKTRIRQDFAPGNHLD